MQTEQLRKFSEWKISYTIKGKRYSEIVRAEDMGIALLRLSGKLGDFDGIFYLNHIYECGTNSSYAPSYTAEEFRGNKTYTNIIEQIDLLAEQANPPRWRKQEILADESEFDQVFSLEDFVPLFEILDY